MSRRSGSRRRAALWISTDEQHWHTRDVPDLVRTQTTQLRDDVRRVVRETRAHIQGGIQMVNRGVQVRITDPADRDRALPKLQELSQPISNPIIGQTANRDIQVTEQPLKRAA